MTEGTQVKITRPESQGIGALIRSGSATIVRTSGNAIVVQYEGDWMLVAIDLTIAASEGITVVAA